MTTLTASSATQLSSDIGTFDAQSHTQAVSGTIEITGNITLAAELAAISLAAGSSLTIIGTGHTITGGSATGGFQVLTGTVSIDDLLIQDATARGGNGVSGGGGGAGLAAACSSARAAL